MTKIWKYETSINRLGNNSILAISSTHDIYESMTFFAETVFNCMATFLEVLSMKRLRNDVPIPESLIVPEMNKQNTLWHVRFVIPNP